MVVRLPLGDSIISIYLCYYTTLKVLIISNVRYVSKGITYINISKRDNAYKVFHK